MNSLEYIKKRFSEEKYCGIEKLDMIDIVNSHDLFKKYYGIELKNDGFSDFVLKDWGRTEINIHYKYAEDADWEYFTYETGLNDGTLLFEYEIIDMCLKRILNCRTYYKEKGFPERLNNSHFYYTFGDIIVVREYRPDLAPKDKPWCTWKVTVILPLIYDFKEGDYCYED